MKQVLYINSIRRNLDFNAKPVSLHINRGNVMFKIGLSNNFYSVQYFPIKNTCQANNHHRKLYIKFQLDILTFHEEILVLLEKLPPF